MAQKPDYSSPRAVILSWLPVIGTWLLWFLLGLAGSRILYEGVWPQLIWLARPFWALPLALIIATLGWRFYHPSPTRLLPFLLNLLYLFDPTIDLVRSRFLFAAAIWLVIVLGQKQHPKRVGLLLLAAIPPIYWLTMPHAVGQADTFEFQVVIPQSGIVHPTGYPLYLILGRLFTLIPFDTIAWRINLSSAVYATAALTLLYLINLKLLQRPLAALLGAVIVGLTPTFWSQAIEAEVYTLHALLVALALWLLLQIGSQGQPRHIILLAAVVGLGLTNHLTTLFLLPPAAFVLLATWRSPQRQWRLAQVPTVVLAFLLPLTLYAYLPLRWAAVNGEAMGLGRFVDWVIGGRFQGALQWLAWLNDPTRYQVVGRLISSNWGLINLTIALIGLVYLFTQQRQMAITLFITGFGFSFYALNYYVPDLSVFLIPVHLVIGLYWAAGVAGLIALSHHLWSNGRQEPVILFLAALPFLLLTPMRWPQIDQSQDDGLMPWGEAVLALPLAADAAILADSEKIAPLYYLQQAEGVRPDLDILVLPDEAAYRAHLHQRLAAGQTVYLARFLPGLEGSYHLRSVGPLTEVSPEPLTTLPAAAVPHTLHFEEIDLVGYTVQAQNGFDASAAAVTLYWQAAQPVTSQQFVYLRWQDHPATPGQHPANNDYPTMAWQAQEIVPDFHLLPLPRQQHTPPLPLQVALAPPFTPADELTWQTVLVVAVPTPWHLALNRPLRQQIGRFHLSAAHFPPHSRPQTSLPVTVAGFGPGSEALQLTLQPVQADLGAAAAVVATAEVPFMDTVHLEMDVPNGRYHIIARHPGQGAVCGWLHPPTAGCSLGEIDISGIPLPLEATNYEDKIALLALDIPDTHLQPGGQFSLELEWQSLAPMEKNYTVFIQVVDEQDHLVGQIDAWPLQGTYPTSQWQPGEIIRDPYTLQLNPDLAPGPYRLLVGWYLLADLRRLSILNEEGQPVDDKVVVPTLTVP